MISNNLESLRVHLGVAKRLSEQASSAFAQVEADSQAAAPTLSKLSGDSYQASLDDEESDSSGAGQSASQGLSALAQQHETLATGAAALKSNSVPLNEALRAAESEARELGIPDVDSWFLRNAIGSASTEEGNASKSAQQIDMEIGSVHGDIGRAQSSAAEVSRDQEGKSVRFSGDQLEDRVDEIEDSFSEINRHSGHGVREQGQVAYFIDQALYFADRLESDFGQTAAPAGDSPAGSPPSEHAGAQFPAPQPSTTVVLPSSQPKPEGFFKQSWQGSNLG